MVHASAISRVLQMVDSRRSFRSPNESPSLVTWADENDSIGRRVRNTVMPIIAFIAITWVIVETFKSILP